MIHTFIKSLDGPATFSRAGALLTAPMPIAGTLVGLTFKMNIVNSAFVIYLNTSINSVRLWEGLDRPWISSSVKMVSKVVSVPVSRGTKAVVSIDQITMNQVSVPFTVFIDIEDGA